MKTNNKIIIVCFLFFLYRLRFPFWGGGEACPTSGLPIDIVYKDAACRRHFPLKKVTNFYGS